MARSRVRGRRIAWLLASALPLVAQDDQSLRDKTLPTDQYRNTCQYDQNQQQKLYAADQSIVMIQDNDIFRTNTALFSMRQKNGNHNNTLRLRPTKQDWSCTMDVEDSKQPWEYTSMQKSKSWDHSIKTTDIFNESDICFPGLEIESSSCPRNLLWNVSSTQIIDDWENNSSNNTTLSLVVESEPVEHNGTAPLSSNETTIQHKHEQGNEEKVTETFPEEQPEVPSIKPVEEEKLFRVDYASKSAGALVLESSDNFQGTSNLLTNNKDAYAIVPCEEPIKSVVIGLSEDILVKHVVLANYERYSSHVKTFQVQGSMTMGNWRDLGTFTASRKGQNNGKHTFELEKPAWARYLKFQFLTHHGNEYYCTISQISVHGSTMLQGFHEQWEEINNEPSTGIIEDNNALERSEIIDSTTIPTCVTPIITDCPKNVLDFESQATFYSSSSDVSSNVHFASIQSLSRSRINSKTQGLPSLSQTLKPRYLVSTKQCNCVTRNLQQMKKGVWSLVERSDTPHILSIRKLLAGLDIEPDTVVKNIVVKLVETKEETKVMTLDKTSSELASAERILVKSPSNDGRKGEGEVALSTNLDMVDNPEEIKSVTTETPLEKTDHFSETGLAFAKALERLPSARCLLDLDFPDFKAKFANAKSTGPSSSGNAQVNSPMEPIFKKLTDEIKALQASVSMHDSYAKESIMCYQRVVMDLMLEMESIRRVQEARILKLEEESRRGFLGDLLGWILDIGQSILNFIMEAMDFLQSRANSIPCFPLFQMISDVIQPHLIGLSCLILRYISTAYDSITSYVMLPGTSAQLSMPYFCKL